MTSSFPVSKITPSYLYVQYQDSDDIQYFVNAYNALAQIYMDWFCNVELPIYTGLNGALLDWIAAGLYGLKRPTLPYGRSVISGPYNTFAYNTTAFDTLLRIGNADPTNYVTSDDTFKRCITWNFYKGDGKVFNVRWLKRRVERFLDGVDGVDPGISTTYDVRIIFGAGTLVNIVILGGAVSFTRRAAYNTFAFNTVAFDGSVPVYSTSRGAILRAGIETGALQLPFQYRYAVYG